MRTVEELINTTGVDVLEHLDRQATVPVLRDPQIQGDVSILPIEDRTADKPIPAAGVVVATGRGGHDHRLIGAGCFSPSPSRAGSLEIGVLTVPEGGEVFMAHDEHGFMGFAPGSYVIGRQREQADEIREVED